MTIKVTTALRYFGSGSYQLDIADNRHISTSQSSVSRNINEVINAVHDSGLFADLVNFPDSFEKIQALRNEFALKSNFPGVIGCIDCTHIAIFPPKLNDPLYPENIYVNRKNYHSINVQLICDSNLRIININARYPGSTQDLFIWNNSNICPIMQELHRRYPYNFVLLGDSGYALRPWMLTPISDPVDGSPEYNYNKAQMSVRSTVERLNGCFKMRWRCNLKHRVLHYSPSVCSKIINTCAALHNMCINYELPDPIPEPEDGLIDFYEGLFNNEDIQNNVHVPRGVNPLLHEARNFQQRIVRNYFTP